MSKSLDEKEHVNMGYQESKKYTHSAFIQFKISGYHRSWHLSLNLQWDMAYLFLFMIFITMQLKSHMFILVGYETSLEKQAQRGISHAITRTKQKAVKD